MWIGRGAACPAVPGDQEICLFIYCFGGRFFRGSKWHLLTVDSWIALGVVGLRLLCVGKKLIFQGGQ